MGWWELPELLDLVAQKYIVYYEDYLNFSGISKLWHSIAVQTATKISYPNGLPSRLPSLLLVEKKKRDEYRHLFFLSNNSIRKIRLSNKPCISSCGWILTVGVNTDSKLINPISCETIDLPNINTFSEFLQTEWDYLVRRVLFSSQSPVVVVVWAKSCRLGFCRIGDKKWTSIETGWDGKIFDITCYDGRVYYFDANYHIRSCDVYGNEDEDEDEDTKVIVDVSQLPKNLYNEDEDEDMLILAYIIGLDDEDDGRKKLLVVIREILDDDDDGDMTKSFKVFEYDLENGEWSKVNDLGRKTLFVGLNSSFWIEDTSGAIKGNCIYYTDHLALWMCDLQQAGAGRDMGIYHMCDGTIEPHFTGKLRSKVTPPIWLQSI